MDVYYVVGHLRIDQFPVNQFGRISHDVLLDTQECRQNVVEELTRTPLTSGWFWRRSNSPVLLTSSVTQVWFVFFFCLMAYQPL